MKQRTGLVKSILSVLSDPKRIYFWATGHGLTKWITDRIHIKIIFRLCIGKWPNLEHPKTFNEKLQWLKLNDRNPNYCKLVDKLAVKQWVSEKIGSEYVAETYGVWDRAESIDLDSLPDRFVLKTNHDCGGVFVCSRLEAFDVKRMRKEINRHLSRNYYWNSREWPYRAVEPLVFAEEYFDAAGKNPVSGDTETAEADLVDYKFMCFGGKCKCIFTCTNRSSNDLRVDFFDTEWRHLPFERHYLNADELPQSPADLRKMIELAESLAEGIPFVRVDFYETAKGVKFGEMTFFPGGGCEEFTPAEWDEKLGEWIDLSLVA